MHTGRFMSKEKAAKKNMLIFIDTNIYLDFYRSTGTHFQKSMIKLLNEHKDKIICTNQVFMEFLKNRNNLIINIFNALKLPNWEIFRTPTFTNDKNIAEVVSDSEKIIEKLINALRMKTQLLIEEPLKHDDVYKFLYEISSNPSKNYLTDIHNNMPECKKSASDKLHLAYPPSKKNERSMGDLLNWEWIIYCANTFSKDVIIVSNDKDFGNSIKDHCHLNEWLKNDFNTRTQKKQNILLTNKLTHGFEMLNVKVPKDAIKEEKQFQNIHNRGLLSALLGENLNNNPFNPDSSSPLFGLLQPLPDQDNKS